MTLTLLAVSLNDKPLSQPITAHFGPEGGTIGRADHNTMALPDPERHISRLQAEIVAAGSQFQIRNVGAANPIVVAGRQVAAGESVPLRHGNEVRIGGYQLKVVDDASADRTGDEITRGRAAIVAQAARVAQAAQAAGQPPRAMPATPAAPLPTHTTAGNRNSAFSTGSPFGAGAAFGPSTPRPGPRSAGGSQGVGAIGALPEVSAAPLSSDNPFADLLGPSPSPAPSMSMPAGGKSTVDDPFADLLPPPAGVSAGSAASAPRAAPAVQLPPDFDPMAMPAKAAAPRQPAPPPAADDPFAGLLPSAAPPSSIDHLFGLGSGGGGGGDPLAAFMAGAAPAAAGSEPAGGGGLSTDPLALFGAPVAAPTAATAPDQVPALQEAFAPPRALKSATPPPSSSSSSSPPRPLPMPEPPAVPAPAPMPAPVAATTPIIARERPVVQAVPAIPVERPQPSPPPLPAPAPLSAPPVLGALFAKTGELERRESAAARPSAAPQAHPATSPLPRPAPPGVPAAAISSEAAREREALWAAFCAGTGVPIDLPGGVSPEMMHIIGQIMINALGGTLRLMSVRANVKQEMRAHMTVIQARSNNPLKFTPDAKAGLEQLLKPPMRGFLAGPEAMTDAMHDLVGHSIGSVVGMRAALEGVLGRFEPDALESKLSSKSLLDAVLPMNRKSRLWELYLQHFEAIRSEAQDDFQALFGKAFLAAYEQQLDRLREESAGSR